MAELKQKQKFEENWKRFTSLTNSTNPEKAPKVEQNEVTALFQEVADERLKQVKVKFKDKLSGIMDAKLALDKTLKQGADELAKKEEKEYEALNKELNEAFQMLNNAKQQGQTLVNAAAGNFTPAEEKEPGEEGSTTSSEENK